MIIKRTVFCLFLIFYFFLWLYHVGCDPLGPCTRDWTHAPCFEVQSLEHWTAVEVPNMPCFDGLLTGLPGNSRHLISSINQLAEATSLLWIARIDNAQPIKFSVHLICVSQLWQSWYFVVIKKNCCYLKAVGTAEFKTGWKPESVGNKVASGSSWKKAGHPITVLCQKSLKGHSPVASTIVSSSNCFFILQPFAQESRS